MNFTFPTTNMARRHIYCKTTKSEPAKPGPQNQEQKKASWELLRRVLEKCSPISSPVAGLVWWCEMEPEAATFRARETLIWAVEKEMARVALTPRGNPISDTFELYTPEPELFDPPSPRAKPRNCKACGRLYQPNHSHQKYCGTECLDKSRKPRPKEKRIKWTGVCAICGATFYYWREASIKTARKTCGPKCFRVLMINKAKYARPA